MPSADAVNSEIFTRTLFSRILLKDTHAFYTVKKIAIFVRFTYISKRQTGFAILRGFYLRETSHLHWQSFKKIQTWSLDLDSTIDLTLEIQCCLGNLDLFGNNYHV